MICTKSLSVTRLDLQVLLSAKTSIPPDIKSIRANFVLLWLLQLPVNSTVSLAVTDYALACQGSLRNWMHGLIVLQRPVLQSEPTHSGSLTSRTFNSLCKFAARVDPFCRAKKKKLVTRILYYRF